MQIEYHKNELYSTKLLVEEKWSNTSSEVEDKLKRNLNKTRDLLTGKEGEGRHKEDEEELRSALKLHHRQF
jgi:hypothetical protein